MGGLFGTGDARGVTNANLTCEPAMSIGRVAAMVLDRDGKHRPETPIGKDTRISSDILEGALVAGLYSIGADMVRLGVVSTPAVIYLVKKYGADAGVMASAPHNPCKFSGIKVFSSTGCRLPDVLKEQIGTIVSGHEEKPQFPTDGEAGSISAAPQALWDYVDRVKDTVPKNVLKGLCVALDCVNDSSAVTAQTLFTEPGTECHMLSSAPNGVNINNNRGSTHMEMLMQYMKADHTDADLASDDNVSRCLAVDGQDQLVGGDFLVVICVLGLRSQDRLVKSAAVGTTVTSMDFICSYGESNIKPAATKVGDRYVLEETLQEGYSSGGEQSGHIISLDYTITDDG